MAYDPRDCLPKMGAGAFSLPAIANPLKKANAGFGKIARSMKSFRGISKRRAMALHVRPHTFKVKS